VNFCEILATVIQSLSSDDISEVNVLLLMCIGLFKCSFYIGGMEGKYQVLWRKVRWGKKETFPGFSPKDRRSNILSEYFA